MTFEAWYHELDELIAAEFGDDRKAHEFLLDHIEWEGAFDCGLPPAEALADVVNFLPVLLRANG